MPGMFGPKDLASALRKNDMTRVDGTQKGMGWLGPMKHLRTGGTSTEISVGVDLGGKETLIPLMVPGLNEMELMYLLANDPQSPDFQTKMPRSIMDKAVNHAIERIGAGQSPFKD